MARNYRRKTSRSYSGRGYSSRRRYGGARKRSVRRSTRGQTIRIVVQAAPAPGPMTLPSGALVKASTPKISKH